MGWPETYGLAWNLWVNQQVRQVLSKKQATILSTVSHSHSTELLIAVLELASNSLAFYWLGRVPIPPNIITYISYGDSPSLTL